MNTEKGKTHNDQPNLHYIKNEVFHFFSKYDQIHRKLRCGHIY